VESIFTPNRIEDAAALAACVVPMVEARKPIGEIIAVCGSDAEQFVVGYKAGLKKSDAGAQ